MRLRLKKLWIKLKKCKKLKKSTCKIKNIWYLFLHWCGRSSGVERNLAKVDVEGSNPFARSNFLSDLLGSFFLLCLLGKSVIRPTGFEPYGFINSDQQLKTDDSPASCFVIFPIPTSAHLRAFTYPCFSVSHCLSTKKEQAFVLFIVAVLHIPKKGVSIYSFCCGSLRPLQFFKRPFQVVFFIVSFG